MSFEPNGRKEEIHLTVTPDRKKWLQENPWVNASGLFEDAIDALRAKVGE